MFALAGWKIYKKRVGQKQTDPIWKQRGIGCGRPRVSMGGYRTELPGTDPLQDSSPSHPRHQVESIQSVGSVGSVGSIASIHPKNSNIPYWYCPLCTPSLTLPPSSLKCLQNYNPSIHRKCFSCFKCFGCFRCFISLLDHKTARFWSKSEQTRQTDRIVLPAYHGYGKHPKGKFPHWSTNTILPCL